MITFVYSVILNVLIILIKVNLPIFLNVNTTEAPAFFFFFFYEKKYYIMNQPYQIQLIKGIGTVLYTSFNEAPAFIQEAKTKNIILSIVDVLIRTMFCLIVIFVFIFVAIQLYFFRCG
jgi:hypothetical protein